MNRLSRHRGAPMVAVAGLLAAATAVVSAAWSPPAGRTVGIRTPRAVPVTARTLVCPNLSGQRGRSVTRFTVAAPPDSGPGSVTVTAVPRAGRPVPGARLSGAGVRAVDVAAASAAAEVTVRGPLAARVAAEQVTRTDGGPARGYAEAACGTPADDLWFVGGSTAVGANAVLTLANPGDIAATADVTVFGTTGGIDQSPGQGVTVSPHGVRTIPLVRFAPDQAALAVHVAVRAGRLAAALLDQRTRAGRPGGVDYVPRSSGPARALVVPGLLPGGGARILYLANPGAAPVTAAVRVVTADGGFVPTGLDAVSVAAGRVVALALDPVLAGRATGVVVRADQPLIAGALVGAVDRATGFGELAWAAATAPLTATAVVADDRTGRAFDGELQLTVADDAAGPAAIAVTAFGADGRPGRVTVLRVPPGRTTVVPLARFDAAPGFALQLRPLPGSAPVYVVRALIEQGRRGVLFAELPVTAPVSSTVVPDLVADAGAGFG